MKTTVEGAWSNKPTIDKTQMGFLAEYWERWAGLKSRPFKTAGFS